MVISTFANMIKLSDTKINRCENSDKVVNKNNGNLYDGVVLFNLENGDMSQALFNRINTVITNETLKKLWDSILEDLKKNSRTLKFFAKHHTNFYKPVYFENRENFKKKKK